MKIFRLSSQVLDSNTFVCIKNNNAIIFDAGSEVCEIKKVLGKAKVIGIFITHAHFDHALHLMEYAKEWNVPIYTHKSSKKILLNSALNYGTEINFSLNLDKLWASYISKDIEFDVGPFNVKSYYVPGHSDSSLNFLVDNTDLFTGDVLFKRGFGKIDLIGGSYRKMFKSLKKLALIKFITCHHGHYEDSLYLEQKSNIAISLKYLEKNRGE